MRHFRDSLAKRHVPFDYRQLDERGNRGGFAAELEAAVKRLNPQRIVMVEPGEWRVQRLFEEAAGRVGIELEMRSDRHFLCSHEEFAEHARGRKQLRMEYFYREMRWKHDVLMEGGKPAGGKWNYDSENRGSFGRSGPGNVPASRRFRPDTITKEVIALVEKRFSDHPGNLGRFDWPVTARQAKQALKDFVENRLNQFGDYQDAMWSEQPYLFHSRLSAALNLKLVSPREVIRAAVSAYQEGLAPLNSVEGFVRQIIGWRE